MAAKKVDVSDLTELLSSPSKQFLLMIGDQMAMSGTGKELLAWILNYGNFNEWSQENGDSGSSKRELLTQFFDELDDATMDNFNNTFWDGTFTTLELYKV